MYEDDFVKEEAVSFDIDGRKFKYLPTTAGVENDWINQYMSLDEDGKPIHDFGKLNQLKFMRLVDVSYEPMKVINVDKPWSKLTDADKWRMIRKLPGAMFDKILKNMNTIDRGDVSVKKNL